MSRIKGIVIVGFGALLLAAGPAGAQAPLKKVLKEGETPKEAEKEAEIKPPALPPGPVDDFDRGVPQTSVSGYLEAVWGADYERAAEYLDLRNLPRRVRGYGGEELARKLGVVLERQLWIDPEILSAEPKGYGDDGLPSYRDFVGRIALPERKVDVLLQHVPRGDGVYIWKFCNATVAEIPALYEQFGYGRLGEALSSLLPRVRILGIELWQWAGLVVVFVVAYFLATLLSRVAAVATRRWGSEQADPWVARLEMPVRLVFFVALAYPGISLLGPTLALRALMQTHTLLIVALAWLVIRTADLLIERTAERLRSIGRPEASMLGRPARNAARGLLALTALLIWLDNVGVHVTTVLAGLGIGGLAVALAAQKSIEDLIAGMTLLATQPVRIGDFCRFEGTMGTVEEIGLRSTRIRTLGDTVVSLPNAQFAEQRIDNFGKRRKIWYRPTLRLRYDTRPDQLRYILIEGRKLLYAHPRVLPEPARVRFIGFGESSLNLDVFAYIDTRDYSEFLEIAEDLNLRITDIVAEAGTSFALPSQTAYLEQSAGSDTERAQTAESHVRAWREKKELFLPRFPEGEIAKLRGSLPYPPEGSPEINRPA